MKQVAHQDPANELGAGTSTAGKHSTVDGEAGAANTSEMHAAVHIFGEDEEDEEEEDEDFDANAEEVCWCIIVYFFRMNLQFFLQYLVVCHSFGYMFFQCFCMNFTSFKGKFLFLAPSLSVSWSTYVWAGVSGRETQKWTARCTQKCAKACLQDDSEEDEGSQDHYAGGAGLPSAATVSRKRNAPGGDIGASSSKGDVLQTVIAICVPLHRV